MRNTANVGRWTPLFLALTIGGLACAAASADVSLLGVQYQEDDPYTEYLCLWHDRNYPTSCGVDLPGANAHVFIKNDGASAVTLDDVSLAGYGLTYALKEATYNDHIVNSIWIRWDDPPQDLLNAGEPAWFKMDPKSIPAGGVGQVIVRLRRVPTTSTIAVNVDTSANTLNTTITVDDEAAQLANISFSQDLKKVYLHWRRAGGAAPTTIKMDGTDVTSYATTVGDADTNYAVSVLSFSTALTELSYHVFQGIYSDNAKATGGIRVWKNPFIYGSWAAFNIADEDYDTAQDWIDTCMDRGMNTLEMNSSSSGLMDYLGTAGGKTYADNHNYGFIKGSTDWGTWSNNPRLWFIDDEPDCEEGNLMESFCGTGYKMPCGSNQAGTMGLHYVSVGEGLRNIKNRPTTINMDGTWKPYSWYAYGQLSDVLCIDSYYPKRVMDSYYYYTNMQPLYEKATAIHATALAGTKAAEPNPFRILLYSCEANPDGYDPWPWSDPGSHQTQVYYALAGGAKGINYWWFKYAPNDSNGLSGNNTTLVPQDENLWREIGLCGAEIKLLQPYLVTSHPIDLDVEGSTDVWVKGLALGTDSLILFAVNDDYYIDEDYHNTAVSNASVTVSLPDWMLSSPYAFEVGRTGVASVSTSLNGSDLTLSLGTLNVAKILIVTVDPTLMMTIRERYDTTVWSGICNFAESVCETVTSAPSFVRHPSAQASLAGGTVVFDFAANGGSQFSYQWQKNSSNLSNGGHYAGCTTPFLTVSSIDGNDVANYRCVVTNPYGSATSNQAALSIITVNITQHPSAQNVCSGSTATFSVTATGQGTLYYQWQKNQTNISNGGHYSGCTTSTLTVSNADSNDVANYRCKVTDSTSTDYSDQAPLVLKTATAITQHPSNQAPASGGTATFTVAATGDGTLTYQWQKNQSNLSNGGHYSGCTTATLTVSSVDSNDEANYRCVVTATCGSVNSNEAVLEIDPCAPYTTLENGDFDDWPSGNVAPNWTSYSNGTAAFGKNTSTYHSSPNAQRVQPPSSGSPAYGGVYQNMAANLGDAVTFVGWTYNESPSSYITSSMGVQFDGSTSRPGSWQTNSSKQTWTSLTIAGNATHATNGVTVFLEANRGTTGTYYADFDDVAAYRAYVPAAPVVASAGSTSLAVDMDPGCNWSNSNAEYAITIGGGAYTLGTHWVQANGSVSTSTVWQTDATWGNKTVTGLSTGVTYTLKTKARYSSTYTQATSLSTGATGAPQSSVSITQQPSAQNVCPGATANFTVAATGQGTITYQWQKNQANLSNGGHYSGCTTATLTVSSADGGDVANYRCVVSDSYDSVNSNEAALTLKSATTITAHPSAQNVCAGATATFSVSATGDGTLTYQWQKNSVNVNNGGHYSGCTTATLTVSSADGSDVANYRCVVTGGCGSANSNQAALSLKAATAITSHPSNQSVSAGGTANFSVTATGAGTLTYQWQKNQSNLSNGGHYSGCTTATLTVSSADANDEANYRCVVTADCGSANSNEATLTVVDCGTPFQNGDFEYWPSGSVAPYWTGAYSATVSSQFVRETSIIHGGTYSQKTKSATTSGAWCHVYQPIDTVAGDALTIRGYLYSVSAATYTVPQIGVNTSSSRPSSWLYSLTSFTKQTWISTGSLACNASSDTTYVFLESKRGASSGDTSIYWDDFVVYQAYLPPAPVVAWASSSSLNVNVDPGCNSGNGSAEYAISIGGGAYTLGTHYVQANGTVSTTTVWQTDSTWGNKTVTGLSDNVTYTFKVKARYSSTYTQATSLGDGAQGTP